MPNLYARQTALSDVGGRIDYISNPKRQENLLSVYDGADATYWKQLALECELASKYIDPKQNKKSVQGRELIVQLSNHLLRRMTPEAIALEISKSFEEEYERPCMVAIHFNKKKTNLHAHIIYSERELLPAPNEKIAPRALFFDEAGKRQYKKTTILDENGELRAGCRIVEKGEVYERRMFGPVDPQFSSKSWLKKAKSEWLLPLRNGKLRGDVEITEYNPATGELPQQHIGNNVRYAAPEIAAQIEEYNRDVKEYNRLVRDGIIFKHLALKLVQLSRRENRKNKALRGFLSNLKEGIKRLGIGPSETAKKKSLDEQVTSAEGRKGTPTNALLQEPELKK